MNNQLNSVNPLNINTIDEKFINNIINEFSKFKNGDKNIINSVINSIMKLKDKIISTKYTDKQKRLIFISCEKILSNILTYLTCKDIYYLSVIDNEFINIKNYVNGLVNSSNDDEELSDEVKTLISEKSPNFDFSKLDVLYIELYNALNQNNKKEITILRGRILKYLKKHDKQIDIVFERLKPLYIIQNILEENLNDDEKKLLIKNLLNKNENQDYANYFKDSINNLNLFIEKYNYICGKLNYNKIIGYIDNYKNELIRYGKDLRKQYETEFLDNNLRVGNFSTVVPNAVAISIKILANTMNQFKETDSKKKKIAKLKEAFGDLGRIISTPIFASGKLLKEYWYTLYMLNKGILPKSGVKNINEKPDVDKNNPTVDLPDEINISEKDHAKAINASNNQNENGNTATVDLPDEINISEKDHAKAINASNNQNENGNTATVDLPDEINISEKDHAEAINASNNQNENGNTATVDLPDEINIFEKDHAEAINAANNQNENGNTATVDLPDEIDVNEVMGEEAPLITLHPIEEIDTSVQSVIVPSDEFVKRVDAIINGDNINIVDVNSELGCITYSNGVVVNFSDRTITYPDGNLYSDVQANPLQISTKLPDRMKSPESINEELKAIKSMTDKDKNDGWFSGWRWVENPGYNSAYSESYGSPPGFFLPGFLADIVEEQGKYTFVERR